MFQRLQPQKKFRISVACVAKLLKIPKHMIVRIECWEYVLFVHRRDCGGQFVSYRKLRQWQNAVACQIQNCSTLQQLRKLWLVIEADQKKYKKQYGKDYQLFLRKIWEKSWDLLLKEQELVQKKTALEEKER
ncbi:MAG: hypothetical protein U7123_28235 [Potamolinea sp.]